MAKSMKDILIALASELDALAEKAEQDGVAFEITDMIRDAEFSCNEVRDELGE